jgi:hypothetical protein
MNVAGAAQAALSWPVVARIAGGSLLALRAFLEENYGGRAYQQALGAIPADLAEPLRDIVLPVNWYPTDAFLGMLHAAQRLWTDPAIFDRYGAFAAEYEINLFQKALLRFTSPTYFLERAGRVWHRFHDSGEWLVEGGDKRLRGTLRNFDVIDADYCRVLTSWIRRAGELTGVRGDVVHPECRARGAQACVFTGWWA